MPEPTEENPSAPARALRPGLVSVGLPVYNGARYLREAVDSILAQDYADFELIISDNCSEDETEAICRDYAARDPRVRYHRAGRNMGPAWNFLRVYRLARGEFFMWAAHDDRRAPRCLSLCVAALRESPRALMCCTGSRMIDAEGRDITDSVPFECRHPTGASARERMRGLAGATAWLDVYALFRTPVIAETSLGKSNVPGGDIIFTAEVCMRGEVVAVPEPLLEYRFFDTKTPEQMAESQGLRGEDAKVSWLWFVSDLLESVRRAPLPRLERLAVGATVAFEMCVRNPSVGWGLRAEGFRGLRRALSRGEYRRALRLAALGSLSQAAGLYGRVVNSASYRGGRLKARMKAEG